MRDVRNVDPPSTSFIVKVIWCSLAYGHAYLLWLIAQAWYELLGRNCGSCAYGLPYLTLAMLATPVSATLLLLVGRLWRSGHSSSVVHSVSKWALIMAILIAFVGYMVLAEVVGW